MHSTPQEICERLLAMGDDLYDDTDEGGRVTKALETLLDDALETLLDDALDAERAVRGMTPYNLAAKALGLAANRISPEHVGEPCPAPGKCFTCALLEWVEATAP